MQPGEYLVDLPVETLGPDVVVSVPLGLNPRTCARRAGGG
jgi:hypothetical protein